jgi:hypothetical protein
MGLDTMIYIPGFITISSGERYTDIQYGDSRSLPPFLENKSSKAVAMNRIISFWFREGGSEVL